MRKFVPILGALIACLLAVSSAIAQKPAATPVVPTSATLGACHFAPDKVNRYVEFDGQMAKVDGTHKMLMRFDLYGRRNALRRFAHLRAPGFGVWRTTASSSVDIFRLRKQVTTLVAPYDYRAVISFRWLDAHGTIVKRARLRTPVCRQPDPRPNLQLFDELGAQPTADPSQALYSVTVMNAGRAAAGAFDVLLSVDGAAQPVQTLTSMAAGLEQVLTFQAPRCTADGSGVRVRVDPDDRVDESVESDNAQTFVCPL
jgi:CARDB